MTYFEIFCYLFAATMMQCQILNGEVHVNVEFVGLVVCATAVIKLILNILEDLPERG